MAYAPAGNLTTSASIRHLATVYYKRKGLDRLLQMFRFHGVTEPDVLPLRNGKTVQWFRYSLFGENTTPSAEGVVGTSLTLDSNTISATVEEYSDFITLASLLEETSIDPIRQQAAEDLGYRAGLSVDSIVRTEFDSNTAARIATLGAAATAGDFRRAVAILRTANVLPRMGDDFAGILHPYVLYDLQSDNTAGGFIDQTKYLSPAGFASSPLVGEAGKVGGVRLMTSTNVRTSGTAPNVLYDCYIIGKGAVGSVDLAGRGPSRVENPASQSFAINMGDGGPSLADPEGKIGGFASYRYVFSVQTLDTTNLRYRVIQADASLV